MGSDLLEIVADEIHRKAPSKFPRRKVVVHAVNDIWSLDLVDMTYNEKVNRGYKHILTMIDLYSRFAWAVPLKSKNADDVLAAYKEVEKEAKAKPKKLWGDEGKEFYNQKMKAHLKKEGTTLYSTYSESKAAVIERFNRTLKARMLKYFSTKNTRKWVDELPKLMDAYNNHEHRSIKTTPAKLYKKKGGDGKDEADEETILEWTPEESKKKKKGKFQVGDRVRISRVKGVFEKEGNNWSRQVYLVAEALKTEPKTYLLTDLFGGKLEGSFYAQELQKTEQGDEQLIEEVLSSKGKGPNKKFLVKWLGLSKKFNSWISEADFSASFKPDTED